MKEGVWSKSFLQGNVLSRIFGKSETMVLRTPSTTALNSAGRFLGRGMTRLVALDTAAFLRRAVIVFWKATQSGNWVWRVANTSRAERITDRKSKRLNSR